MLLPILDEGLNILGTVEFIDNLTLSHVPEYVNMNGKIGLTRLGAEYGTHAGEYVLMYYDKRYPENSYAEIVTKKEAYRQCLNRGKLELATELDLKYIREVELI